MGPYLWTKIVFIIAAVSAVSYIMMTLFTLLYHRFWYAHIVKPRLDGSYEPSCTVVVPIKNEWPELSENIRAFLSQKYSRYTLVFSVESKEDPAYAAVRRELDALGNKASHARLVVAGLSQHCAQKNRNLLAALEQEGDAQVYVFGDADIRVPPGWLHALVLPLSNPKVSATSGFRWMIMRRRPRRQQAHVYENNFLYTLFSTACFFGGVGLWGGSMAIRRDDFEKMGVARYWAETGVDDMTLSQLVIKHRSKAVLVPECVMDTEDTIPTVGKAVGWFTRQSMFLKAYHKPVWAAAIPVGLVLLALHALLPVSIVVSLTTDVDFIAAGGAAALIGLGGDMISVMLYPAIGEVPKFFRFVLWHTLYRSIPLLGFMATLGKNSILWGNVRYVFNFSGKVTKVQR